MSYNNLNISLFPINEQFKIERIASAGDYILYKHLNRNLIEIDANGQIYGDLINSWNVNKNHTIFKFKLKKNIFFSDKTPITPEDVKYSIDYLIAKKGGIHFDFSKIKEITINSKDDFSIELNESNPRFLRGLSHPEFGIRKKHNKNIETNDVTSGCYKIKSVSKKEIILERNETCDYATNNYKYITLSFSPPLEQKNSMKREEKDFYISMLNNDEINEVLSSGKYDYASPHIGFTFWITINPNSTVFKKIANRQSLIKKFSENFKVKNEIDTLRAEQLYLPDGPGRLSKEEIKTILEKMNSQISSLKKKSVSIFLPKTFSLNNQIIDFLKEIFDSVQVGYYSNQNEFIENDYQKYDLFITNNDFSSIDLYENISVTFNPVRPLIYKNKLIDKSLSKLNSISDESILFEEYKNIAKRLIDDGLIIPLIHKKVIFIKKKNIDISEWSQIYPEVSLWKMKLK